MQARPSLFVQFELLQARHVFGESSDAHRDHYGTTQRDLILGYTLVLDPVAHTFGDLDGAFYTNAHQHNERLAPVAGHNIVRTASYCSGTTVRFVLHPLCEPPHSGMVSKRLHGIIASCKVCVVDRDVYVSVAGAAQGDCPAWVASLELLSTLPSALHLPRARARQEMVAGETILSEGPAAQLAPACGAMP